MADSQLTLYCPCGERITADDEDSLVAAARRHLQEFHPDLADSYSREEILSLAL